MAVISGDDRPEMRVAAIRVLEGFGAAVMPVIRPLLPDLERGHPSVRFAAAETVRRLSSDAGDLRIALR